MTTSPIIVGVERDRVFTVYYNEASQRWYPGPDWHGNWVSHKTRKGCVRYLKKCYANFIVDWLE